MIVDGHRHPFASGAVAELYDHFPFEADVPFYLDLAAANGPKVLEVASGTGRLLVPLARAGFEVVGLDASRAMLDICRRKLAAEASDVRRRVRLAHGDMRAFELGQCFDVAALAVKSFFYLQSRDDQLAALGAVARHLRPGGRLALDLLHPTPAWLSQAPGSVRQDLRQVVGGGTVVTRTETVVDMDFARQVRVVRSEYELTAPDGTVSRRLVEWPLRYVFPQEAEHLLERAGLEVEGTYGGYAREPLDDGSAVLLLVGRRRS